MLQLTKGARKIMIRENITLFEINKIFDNKQRKLEYLNRLYDFLGVNFVLPRTKVAIDNSIIDTWNYDTSKNIIREMFFESDKYLYGIACKDKIDYLINNWHEHNLGEIKWPFSAMNFDGHVARINRMDDASEEQKDDMISYDVIKFRRIKDINACRNDYIESLIVKYNDNIIPTFKHCRGIDFYIDGIPFDQKVSRSVGRSFIDEYGDNYYNIAINHPELVAKSLYENQDEERFDDEPRLYVVYLDNNLSSNSIERTILNTDFNNPIDIQFEYLHSNHNLFIHDTYCYIILLHN